MTSSVRRSSRDPLDRLRRETGATLLKGHTTLVDTFVAAYFFGCGTRSTTVELGRRSASFSGTNSPVRASLPRGEEDSAPSPGFGTRSTVVVEGCSRASFTGMNCPLLASRPFNVDSPFATRVPF